MKGHSFFFMSLLSAIAGVILILTYSTVSSTGLVVLGGVLFIVAGLLNLVLSAAVRRGRGVADRKLMPVLLGYLTSGAAVLLGLSMLVFKTTFSAVVPYLFCMLMVVAALMQLYILLSRQGRILFSSWFLLVPVALAALGIYIAYLPAGESDSAIMLMSGIGLAVDGLALAAEGIVAARGPAVAATPAVEDVSASEVSPDAVRPLDSDAK